MDFPSRRFHDAGATLEEVRTLEQRFEALPEHAKASHLEHLASIAHGDLVELLDHLRGQHQEHDDVDVETDPQPPSEIKLSDGSKI